MTIEPNASRADRHSTAVDARWLAVIEIAIILLVFFIEAGWPPPDPNEAHYLGKAKHFWNPAWVPSDFFFDSADTHLVFYICLGWLTRWLPLAGVAWCGRWLTWTLLAIAWRRLSFAIVPRWGWAALTAAVFVTLNDRAHMAGEWVVGGFEAKGIAYALVFFALGELVRNRWNRVWLLLGAASAFHVLVGGWTTVAVAFCWLVNRDERPSFVSMLPALAGGGLLALAGLWPALALSRGASPEAVAEANDIYVYRRLYHHLTPQGFPRIFVERHLLLLLVWLTFCAFTPGDAGRRRLRWTVAGAVLIALTGMAIGLATSSHPPWAASLLRFYWFRLSDALLPLGVAFAAAAFLVQLAGRRLILFRAGLGALLVLTLWHLGPLAVDRVSPVVPRADGRGKVINHADWRHACEWIAEHTPADACFLTPRAAQTFKWYAGRSEVVSWKDIPQNATEIVEWWQRMQDVHGADSALVALVAAELGNTASPPMWYNLLADESVARLKKTGAKYHAGYVLTSSEPPLALPVLYTNASYTIYQLPP
jgi:hypothetical protein